MCEDADIKICFSSLDKMDKIKTIRKRLNTLIIFDDKVDDRAYLMTHNHTIKLPSYIPL